MSRIRVLVVDDSAVARRLVVSALAGEPDFEVVGMAANGREALAHIERDPPDAMTLDVEMPEMDGLALCKELQRRPQRIAILMLSSRTERGAQVTMEALAAGAGDYVTKPHGLDVAHAKELVRSEVAPRLRALVLTGRRARPGATPQPSAVLPAGPGKAAVAPAARLVPAASGAAPVPPIPMPRATGTTAAAPTTAPVHAALARLLAPRVRIVAIGVSTGGPEALARLFAGWKAPLQVPIVVVQHMPPVFTKVLAERLTAAGRIPTSEAVDGAVLEAGQAYIAPGDYHLTVAPGSGAPGSGAPGSGAPGSGALGSGALGSGALGSGALGGVGQPVLRLNQAPPENSCRPSVDVLFRSVAEVYGASALTVVMTGMGQDGLLGAEAVRAAGGLVLAQDEETSVVWGMPGAVARAGLATELVPLPALAEVIERHLAFSAVRPGPAGPR